MTKENKDIQDDNNFETALAELEEIVKKIETGDLSLDENLELFERGISLTRLCSSKLEHARQRIEKLIDENMVEDMEMD
ncbi:MAG: exodeoxyribonuclease VII small subunit [Methanosarcinales archaeon]|nr:exodeoxyribonuclease VII small subunit [Methanosarcinales archaeon]